MTIQFNSPIQIATADGIVTVGQFDKLFEGKIEQAAIGKPNPVIL